MSCPMSAQLHMAHPRSKSAPAAIKIARRQGLITSCFVTIARDLDCDLGATDLAQVLEEPGRI
jgi:hypothetical protein